MKGYLRISPVLAGVMMATGTVGAAGAQCVTTQDCKALGYTEASCSGGKGVKCPFGNGWYCGSGEVTPEQCSKLGFSYSCSGTGYAGGAGSACGGKYAQCKCAEGYEWKDGSCQKQTQNGAVGDLYYCNGAVVGVKAPGMNFFVAIEDIIDDCVSVENEVYDCNRSVLWGTADLWAARAFCGKGRLPTKDELLTIYNNKSKINSLSTAAGGQNLAMAWYWSSTVNFDTASETDDHVGFNGYYTVNMADGRHGWVYGQEWYSARPVLVEGNF